MAKDLYSKSDAHETSYVSEDGANAYSMLLSSYLKKDNLFSNVANWMEKYLDRQRLDIETSLDRYEFRVVRADHSTRIQEVGQGVTQVLPIIVQSFIQQHNSVMIVEEPELHLHPSAHAPLMELIAHSASNNGGVALVETHSENMVLALRRMVARGELSTDKVSIAYIDFDDETGEAVLKPINIKSNGSLSYWPNGVFSESYDLLNDILTF